MMRGFFSASSPVSAAMTASKLARFAATTTTTRTFSNISSPSSSSSVAAPMMTTMTPRTFKSTNVNFSNFVVAAPRRALHTNVSPLFCGIARRSFWGSAAAATSVSRTSSLYGGALASAMRMIHTSNTNSDAASTASTASTTAAATASSTPSLFAQTAARLAPKKPDNQLQGFYEVDKFNGEEEEGKKEQNNEDPFNADPGQGYLPFPAPFHTFNIVMILFTFNVLIYLIMKFCGSDDVRDFMVEHFTLSHDNWTRIYPLFTNALYQENLLQMAIDCWLLWQFGKTMLGFLGNARMTFFAVLCVLGGDFIHIARQYFQLYYCEMDPLEVRGRCFGPNPFILGLISVEGLIFRHLNFIQQPPVPFLVLTAFVMVIDVWRIFTTHPQEHGASTGGALVAYFFWLLPTRMLGLDKLTAAL